MTASELIPGRSTDPRRWAIKANVAAAASCKRFDPQPGTHAAAREVGHLVLAGLFARSMVAREAGR